MKPNIVEINIVRAFAILAVLLIHVTAGPRTEVPWGSLSAPFYFTANQLSMFAVPLFLMLSGLVLFYRYHDDWSMGHAWTFYKKRLKFIVIPYLVWSVIYYFFYQAAYRQPFGFDPVQFAKLLIWGDASYHLYFMAIIIQLYLVFPLLMGLMRLLRMKALHILLLGLIIEGAFMYIHYNVYSFEHKATLIANYFAVFCAGAAIGMRYESFANRYRNVWWTGPLAVIIVFMYMLFLLSSQAGAQYPMTAYIVAYNVYAILVGISLIWAGKIIVEQKARILPWLLAFGSASFGIYFIHPAIQTTVGKLIGQELGSPYYHVYQIGLFATMLAVSFAVVHYTKKIKLSWLLWGK
ncbi:acyltransferase [Paenibacillus sp. LHD-117]|uniref:acyltransferase n=1 Tax=Paenibacillus sp. LHD-117 TaxID=3071412 RepID=UPI0027E0B59D|nr:acyltransferase [Paenibacillus sp. LHD-117]MDQ6421372.1 acyltransferase [Paenibacillus sp. LHD-117]